MPTLRERVQAARAAYKAFWGGGDWISQNHARTSSRYQWQPGTNIDYGAIVGDLWRNTAVQACLNKLIMAWPESYPCVKRQQGEKKVRADDHPLTDVLLNPNEAYDDTVLWAGTILSFWTDGNAYWGINRDATQIREFVYLPHKSLRPMRNPNSISAGPDYYEYYHDGKTDRVDPADIVHFRFGVDPANDLLGLSPWASVDREVYTDNEAVNYANSMLKNKGAAWIIAAPEHPDAFFADPGAVKDKIEAHTSGDNRHRALVLDGATKLTFPPSMKDTGSDALRRTPEARIAALAGLPAMWVGLSAGLERSTYSNTEQAERDAWQTIVAVQRMMGRQATRQLLRRPGNFETRWQNKKFFVGFDYSEVRALQPDKVTEWKRIGEAVSIHRLITVDEGRAEIGYDPLTEEQKAELMPEPTEPDADDESGDETTPAKSFAALRERIAVESSAREQEFKRILGLNPAEDDDEPDSDEA